MGKNKENSPVNVQKLAKTLKQFFEGANNQVKIQKAEEAINLLLTTGIYTSAQIFTELSKGKGNSSTHLSDFIEGELVPMSKYHGRKRPNAFKNNCGSLVNPKRIK
jgi:hypothetical protein